MKQIISLLIWLIVACSTSTASAGLYAGCITGYNFGDNNLESFSLYPVNSNCYVTCSTGCSSIFSQLDSAGIELNQDVINRCQSFCQSSVPFSSYYRTASGTLQGPTSGVPSPSACVSDQVWNRVYKAQTTFSPGSTFTVSMVTNDYGTGNKIYGCGQDSVSIKSIFSGNRTSDWTSTNTQTIWTDSSQHYCLNSTTDNISSITVGDLTSGLNYSVINNNLLPSQPLPYADSNTGPVGNMLPDYRKPSDLLSWYQYSTGPCRFSARASSISTGLYVQDGDELSISWSGNYSRWQSTYTGSSCGCNTLGMPLDQSIMCARNIVLNPSYKVTIDGVATPFTPTNCQKGAIMQSDIVLSFNGRSSTTASFVLNGENARTNPIFTKGTSTSSTVTNASSNYTYSSYDPCSSNPSALGSNPLSVYGLVGSVYDDPNPVVNNPYSGNKSCSTYWSGGACPDSSINCSSCVYINGTNDAASGTVITGNIQYSKYNYQGVLSGVSTTARQSLTLGMYALDYSDNIGGVDATITWGGCPMTPSSTNAIEYLVASCSLDPSQMYDASGYYLNTTTIVPYTWTTLPFNTAVNVTSCGSGVTTCCVYLRVKDPYITQTLLPSGVVNIGLSNAVPTSTFAPLWSSGKVTLKNLYGNSGNRAGYYSLTLGTPSTTFTLPQASTTGVMQGIVKYVNNTIIGTQNAAGGAYTNGVLNQFYVNVIAGKGYASFVRALLSMYIAFFGLGFIMGTVEINLRELVTRLFKVAFVLALISDSGWTMFSTYILPAVVNGAADLSSTFVITVANSSNMSTNFPSDYQTTMTNDPSALIALMVDQPLKYIWGTTTLWLKAGALIFSAWWGVPFFIMLVTSMIIYSIGLLKIVMIYCLVLIGVGVLIFIAPLVIPMMLFKFTESVFETWWKLLLSYAMQPVLLFAGVAILNFLTLAVFFASLSYTICPYCLLSTPFFGSDYCLLYVYTILDSFHSPSSMNGFIPTALIHSSSLFLLLSYAMFEMPSVFTGMAAQLVTGTQASNAGSASDGAFKEVGMGSAGQIVGTVINVAEKAQGAYAAGRSAVEAAGIIGSAASKFGRENFASPPPSAPPSAPTASPAGLPPAAARAESKEVMPQAGGAPSQKASIAPKLSSISEGSTSSSMDSIIAEGDEGEEE